MKKLIVLSVLFISCFFISCEKDYKEEVFNDKYLNIYGEWKYTENIGMMVPLKTEDYTIEFIQFGKFSFNGGKPGNIKIIDQTEMSLTIDFNDLFPKTGNSYLGLNGSDTLIISPVGADMSGRLFVRINK